MDTIDLILREVQQTRQDLKEQSKDLKDHIREEDIKQELVRKDIHTLQKEVALSGQRSRFINAGLAAFVSGITAWIVSVFGVRFP